MFRFTIRELCLATIIASLALAWWLDHGRMARRLEESRRLQRAKVAL